MEDNDEYSGLRTLCGLLFSCLRIKDNKDETGYLVVNIIDGIASFYPHMHSVTCTPTQFCEEMIAASMQAYHTPNNPKNSKWSLKCHTGDYFEIEINGYHCLLGKPDISINRIREVLEYGPSGD